MHENASKTWREQGAAQAFDHGAWEFQSRQFCSSARQLLQLHDAEASSPNFDSLMCLPSAVFLLSLAIEQVSKAYYLRSSGGPKEDIYSHKAVNFCGDKLLSTEQQELMAFAEANVVWAGRYPTPKWTKETLKQEYDVPSCFIDGVEHIEALKLPTLASRERANELLGLYEHIHEAWRNVENA